MTHRYLFPFALSQALPRAFGYYGNSVAISLAAGRRSRLYACQTSSTCRCPVRFLAPFIAGYSPQRAFRLTQATSAYFLRRLRLRSVAVSPLQVCCGGSTFAPLEAGVQPIQVSPCVQDSRRVTLHTFALSRFANMLLSPLGFPARSVGRPRRSLCSLPSAPVELSRKRRSGARQSRKYRRSRAGFVRRLTQTAARQRHV